MLKTTSSHRAFVVGAFVAIAGGWLIGTAGLGAEANPGYQGAARTFLWNPNFNDLVATTKYKKNGPYRIGFSNASVADLWLVTFKNTVEWAAAQNKDQISKLIITDANGDPNKQIADIQDLLNQNVDLLIVNPAAADALDPILGRAMKKGVPVVTAARRVKSDDNFVSFVTASDTALARLSAQWLAEKLNGKGKIVLLPGLAGASPAEMRLRAAKEVFAQYPEIEILDTQYTGWSPANGKSIMSALIQRHGKAIQGVWADSGLQGSGSVEAFLNAGYTGKDIPPHTGGDLNRMYQLASEQKFPFCGIDYTPSIGGASVFLALDVLHGKPVPKRLDVNFQIVVSEGDETTLEPRRRVNELSVADQQMVEIAKALVGEAKLLILDEPTAVISGRDADVLFDRLRSLQKTGVCLIYVSHRLEELFALVDRVTVLKDGKTVGCWPIRELDRPSLITKMVGRTLDKIFPPKKPLLRRDIVLAVRGVSAGTTVKDVSFDLCRGEVLGLAGLVGAGRSELAYTLFGSLPLRAGTIEVAEADLRRPSPRRAIASGIGFLTEDRKSEGLFMNLPVAANISAPNLRKFCSTFLIRQAEEQRLAAEEIKKYSIAAPSAKSGVKFLSGGNQQKILISRWVQIATNVLILDEPTRGVDVGAKVEIYRIIRILAERGIGILAISSELPEIIGLCDRVLVMRAGRITGELNSFEIAEEPIMHLATQ